MTKKAIGNALKTKIKQKKLSIYRLSQQSGVKITPIQSILSGSANYTIESLLKVANALEINLWNVKEPM